MNMNFHSSTFLSVRRIAFCSWVGSLTICALSAQAQEPFVRYLADSPYETRRESSSVPRSLYPQLIDNRLVALDAEIPEPKAEATLETLAEEGIINSGAELVFSTRNDVPVSLVPNFLRDEVSESVSQTLFQLPTPPKRPQTQKIIDIEVPLIESEETVAEPEIIPPAPLEIAAESPLSEESREMLDALPEAIEPEEISQEVTYMEIRRYDPEIEDILAMPIDGEDTVETQAYEGEGVNISMKRPSLDVAYELQKAYEAFSLGETYLAIEIYKDILREEPGNTDALFGIAAAFHRTGELDLARPFYQKLLRVDPKHPEGLNNLLVMVAEESPIEALKRLNELQKQNTEFAPIQAQLGMLYQRMGEPEKARYHLLRAVKLSPEHIDYKYNLAVLFDENGMLNDAIALYRKILQAGRNGESLPAKVSDIEARLIYLSNLMSSQ